MTRKKLLRFAELEGMENVVDGRRSVPGWFERIFGHVRAVHLDLGCGHGDSTLAMARRLPGSWFLGVDRNGGRLWKGARRALDEGLSNTMFLRAPVETLKEHVPPGRVKTIWTLFPDPLSKSRQSKHRLVSPGFLVGYRRLLAPGGAVHLKTDDPVLIDFAERAVRQIGGKVSEGWANFQSYEGEGTVSHTTFERRYRDQGRVIYQRTLWL
jgi:tRNA (guanine-N7-)-methyltransferase